jgi:hypothetical protein
LTKSHKCDLCNEDSSRFFRLRGSKRSIIFTTCLFCAERNEEFIPTSLGLELTELSLEEFIVNEVMESSNMRVHPAKFMRIGITVLGDFLL